MNMSGRETQKPQLDTALLRLAELGHQLQLERGCTALFLDSAGELFHNEWRDQCKETDLAVQELNKCQQGDQPGKTNGEAISKKIQLILSEVENLEDHRRQIASFDIGFAKAINHYTYTLLSPILDLKVEIALMIAVGEPAKVTAYSNLLQWKERVGRERAWGVHGFYSGVFRNREFSERMRTLIEEQKAYRRSFLSLASDEHSQFLDSVFEGYVMQCVEELHKMLDQPESADELEALSPITWFRLLTGKVERLKLVENKLVQDFCAKPEKVSVKTSNFSANSAQLDKYMPLIQALPAFSKLDRNELDSLLSHADVREAKKGKLLFLQSEPLSRMYLILSGWVKLYKGTDAGNEAVLQMLSAGDSVMEASVFLDIPSVASAQVVEDAILLSLPAPVVRQVLQENKSFALNMLGNLSLRSQNLIRQIEHSRLRKASERVGWFLLKLGLEEGNENATCIRLPYDKSLIASYLDMTPETFSRTLKKFRDRGFHIENDTVTQPDPKALCAYCDPSLADACKFRDDPDCPGTYL
ncbi:MAG: hypothetical protein COA47_08825 [Robiginitomaculum sp.]|nr:MAG: hypothetical protein COA47_08825 [Robiginitomaculum sp.]